jgi:pimeloyl-ACP methyl ester carboxylesterase
MMLLRHHRWLFLLLLMFSSIVQAQAEVEWISTDCPFALPAGEVLGETVDCGVLRVPEIWTNPTQEQTLQLPIAILKAQQPISHVPLVYLEGGPGTSALGFISLWWQSSLRQHRDIILFDARGVGYSRPSLACYESDLGACYQRLVDGGIRLDAYTTSTNVRDVHALVNALGHEQVDIWGVSYGSRFALAWMQTYPQQIRYAVLDAVYPPDVMSLSSQPMNAERARQAFFDMCAQNSICAQDYPDLAPVYADVVARLQIEPLTWLDSNTGIYLQLRASDFVATVNNTLTRSNDIPYLPAYVMTIYRTLLNDALESAFTFWENVPNSVPDTFQYAEGVFLAIQCHEEVPFNDATPTIVQDQRANGMFDIEVLQMICDQWQITPSDTPREPFVSDIPTLLFSGELDPLTPPAWGERVAQSLSQSLHLILPNSGHGVVLEDCALQIADEFLLGTSLDALNTSCIEALRTQFMPLEPSASAP